MIQRIQTVYLLLAVVALVWAMCVPVGSFVGTDGVTIQVWKPLGINVSGVFQSTWGLFGILLLSAMVSLCSILLYGSRKLQMRMALFAFVLLAGYYVVLAFFIPALMNGVQATGFRVGWALCLPLVAAILDLIAWRAIRHDEEMVKAADRLR